MKSCPLCALPGQVVEKLFRSFFLLGNFVPFLKSSATLFKVKKKKKTSTEKVSFHPEMAPFWSPGLQREVSGDRRSPFFEVRQLFLCHIGNCWLGKTSEEHIPNIEVEASLYPATSHPSLYRSPSQQTRHRSGRPPPSVSFCSVASARSSLILPTLPPTSVGVLKFML